MPQGHDQPDFAGYRTPLQDGRRRVLMLSEINTIPFLENTFRDHPDYHVVNDSLEAILAYGVPRYIERVVADIEAGRYDFDGIAGFFNTPNAIACVLSHLTGKPATPIDSVVRCQSKLEARRRQHACIPEYTPAFSTATAMLSGAEAGPGFPCFAKPVRGARSFSSVRVEDRAALERLMQTNRAMLEAHNAPYIEAIRMATDDAGLIAIAEASNEYVCEGIIAGEQYAIDGYVRNGAITYHGIVREVFMPGTVSFERHEFPAALPPVWDARLRDMAERLVRGGGLDNTEFDIELGLDMAGDRMAVIEMNPYAVSQYENMFTLAGGDQMLVTICALACGVEPPARIEPPYGYCYSCELRTRVDQVIRRVPSQDDIDRVQADFPDVRVVNRIPPGAQRLSDFRQTEDSFRYCIVSIPGDSPGAIFETLQQIETRLNYRFDAVPLKEVS